MNKVTPVAKDVFFHEGDIEGHGHCNNGWIVFKDYVLVVDANFPSGARTVLPKIRAITPKPIRFAFDTHHHGDHAYGNEFWVENGATPLAHTGVIEEMKRYETGYYDSKPGRWEEMTTTRPDVAASRLSPPSVLFPRELYFDDGEHRVELHYLGVAHTHGDAVAWLPRERILFTGDICVKGPYNFVGDGNVEQWIGTLEAAKKLGAQVICPGHGRDVSTLYWTISRSFSSNSVNRLALWSRQRRVRARSTNPFRQFGPNSQTNRESRAMSVKMTMLLVKSKRFTTK